MKQIETYIEVKLSELTHIIPEAFILSQSMSQSQCSQN